MIVLQPRTGSTMQLMCCIVDPILPRASDEAKFLLNGADPVMSGEKFHTIMVQAPP